MQMIGNAKRVRDKIEQTPDDFRRVKRRKKKIKKNNSDKNYCLFTIAL